MFVPKPESENDDDRHRRPHRRPRWRPHRHRPRPHRQRASRYLQQLCKHWQHNLEVRFTPDHGEIVFPRNARGADWPADGLVTFDASADQLTVTVAASSPDHLAALEGAVARHLDRFAFREAPLRFDWQAA